MEELLIDMLQTLYSKVYADQEKYWDTHVFVANYPKQTPYDKYMEGPGAEDFLLIQRIYKALEELQEVK